MHKTEIWVVTTAREKTVAVFNTLDDAMAWCDFDNFGMPIRWLAYNDCLRSLGPYMGANTNRGYTIAVSTW